MQLCTHYQVGAWCGVKTFSIVVDIGTSAIKVGVARFPPRAKVFASGA